MNDGAFKLRDRLRQERSALVRRFTAGGAVDALLRGLSRSVDRLLREVAEASGITSRATLIAVGGYGRGELFPHSDVDVLILLNQPVTENDARTIENLVSLLWDLVPLGPAAERSPSASPSSRDITSDCVARSRLLAGRARVMPPYRAIVKSLARENYFRAKCSTKLCLSTRSAYSLEPKVKEAPGGCATASGGWWPVPAARRDLG